MLGDRKTSLIVKRMRRTYEVWAVQGKRERIIE